MLREASSFMASRTVPRPTSSRRDSSLSFGQPAARLQPLLRDEAQNGVCRALGAVFFLCRHGVPSFIH